MNITIIGTGNMARGIGTRALAGGNNVTLIGHGPGKAENLASELQSATRGASMRAVSESRSASQGGASVQAGSASAPLEGEIVVLAVPYSAAAEVVKRYGDQLADKVVVDITNPVDFSTMSPAVAPGSSGAEEIAKAAPAGARVVKAFNTTFAGTLVAGQVAGQPLDVLLAGDDAVAKATVRRLVESGGLRAIDAGPLHRARQLEALGLLHMALQSSINTGFSSAVKVLA
jgi:predicted dinucleotide-binding enzyme